MKAVAARCEEHRPEDEAQARADRERLERARLLMARLRTYLDTPDAAAAGFTFQYQPPNDPVRVYARHSDEQVFGVSTDLGLLMVFTHKSPGYLSLEEAKPCLVELASDWLRAAPGGKVLRR